MERKVIKTAAAPGAVGPYSQAVACDGWLYVSGQIPLDPQSGEMVAGDIGVQADRVLTSLAGILEEAGAGFSDVVKVQVYLTDMDDFQQVNEVYARFFGENRPARACVAVAGLPRGAQVEIDLVARLGAS
jgi:2-iminobutanoate/2-iminopropanoate deaminase